MRLNELMRAVLQAGGQVGVHVIEEASAEIDSRPEPLDLTDKTARVLVESAWLLTLKSSGLEVENA